MARTKTGFSTGKGYLTSVDNATNATNTDLTNANWANGSVNGVSLVAGKNYQIRRGSDTALVVFTSGEATRNSLITTYDVTDDALTISLNYIVITINGNCKVYVQQIEVDSGAGTATAGTATAVPFKYRIVR